MEFILLCNLTQLLAPSVITTSCIWIIFKQKASFSIKYLFQTLKKYFFRMGYSYCGVFFKVNLLDLEVEFIFPNRVFFKNQLRIYLIFLIHVLLISDTHNSLIITRTKQNKIKNDIIKRYFHYLNERICCFLLNNNFIHIYSC